MASGPPIQEQSTAVRQFFDADAAQYLFQRYETPSCGQNSYLQRKQAVLEMLASETGKMLDVGCGPAVFTIDLAGMGFRVFSVDLSHTMVRTARSNTARIPEAAKHFAQAETCHLPFKSDTFDCAICIGVLGYLLDAAQGLKEIHRILKPGGCAVVQISNRWCPTPYVHRWLRSVHHLFKSSVIVDEPHAFRLTKYSPKGFSRLLESAGFRSQNQAFYDFNPPLLEVISPALALKATRRLQCLGRSKVLGWLGEGLLLKVRKP